MVMIKRFVALRDAADYRVFVFDPIFRSALKYLFRDCSTVVAEGRYDEELERFITNPLCF